MKHKTTLHFLAERNRRYIPGLILLTLLEVARAYLGVEFAMVTRQVIDCAQGGSAEKLTRAALLLAAVVAGIMVLYASAQYLRGWLRATLDREWKTRLSHKLLHGDYATVSAYHSGELVNRLTSDVEAVNGGVIALIPNVAALLTRLVSAVWMMATMEPTFTLLAVACGLVVIGATGFFRQRLKTLHKQMQEANGKANGFVQEIMEKLLAVQAMSVEAETEAREKKILDSRWKLQMRQQRFSIMGHHGHVSGLLPAGRRGAGLVCAAADAGRNFLRYADRRGAADRPVGRADSELLRLYSSICGHARQRGAADGAGRNFGRFRSKAGRADALWGRYLH